MIDNKISTSLPFGEGERTPFYKEGNHDGTPEGARRAHGSLLALFHAFRTCLLSALSQTFLGQEASSIHSGSCSEVPV